MTNQNADSADPIVLEIDGDDGVLALVIAGAYRSFVHADWDEDNRLWDHFARQTDAGNILVWSCGDGGDLYRIKVSEGFTEQTGYRESIGVLRPESGTIHLASYTAITMAAQFDDCTLPAKEEVEIRFSVPRERLKIRVVQMYDPKTVDYDNFPPFHFLIEYEPCGDETYEWGGMEWDNLIKPAELARAESAPAQPKPGLIARLFGKRKK